MEKRKLILSSMAVFLCLLAIVVIKCTLRPEGYMRVTVRDGFSDDAIEGARVYIPELNLTLYTNKGGMSELITIPIKKEPHYEAMKAQDYGIVTVLVYKSGYIPYGLFYAHVLEGELRQGPVIYLFPDEGGNAPFVVIESPGETWARDFILERERD